MVTAVQLGLAERDVNLEKGKFFWENVTWFRISESKFSPTYLAENLWLKAHILSDKFMMNRKSGLNFQSWFSKQCVELLSYEYLWKISRLTHFSSIFPQCSWSVRLNLISAFHFWFPTVHFCFSFPRMIYFLSFAEWNEISHAEYVLLLELYVWASGEPREYSKHCI